MTTQNTITITSIVDSLAETTEGVTKKQLKEVVDGVVSVVTDALVRGDVVRLNGLGTLSTADTKARTGRNPKSGEPLEIAASKRVAFSAAKGLKDAVKATV